MRVITILNESLVQQGRIDNYDSFITQWLNNIMFNYIIMGRVCIIVNDVLVNGVEVDEVKLMRSVPSKLTREEIKNMKSGDNIVK